MATQKRQIKHVTAQSDVLDLANDIDNGNVAETRFWVDVDGQTSNLSISKYGLDIVQGQLNRAKFHKPRRLSLDKDIDILYPEKTLYANKNPHNITSIDVSPDRELILLGDDTGGLDVVSIRENGRLRRSLAGHLVYTSLVKFFPSGQVAVSAGSDMQIKIWSVIDGSNPRTLVGHKGPISCLEMIGRGRNIVSGGNDGKVILWECGSGQKIRSVDLKNEITGLNILSWSARSAASKDGIYDAEDKALAVSTTKSLRIVDIADPSHSFLNISVPDRINCLTSWDKTIAIGSLTGQVYVYDIRNPSAPIWNFSKSSHRSEIQSLAFKSSTGLTILDQSTVETVSIASNESVSYYIHQVPPKTFIQTSEHIYTGGKNGLLNIY